MTDDQSNNTEVVREEGSKSNKHEHKSSKHSSKHKSSSKHRHHKHRHEHKHRDHKRSKESDEKGRDNVEEGEVSPLIEDKPNTTDIPSPHSSASPSPQPSSKRRSPSPKKRRSSRSPSRHSRHSPSLRKRTTSRSPSPRSPKQNKTLERHHSREDSSRRKYNQRERSDLMNNFDEWQRRSDRRHRHSRSRSRSPRESRSRKEYSARSKPREDKEDDEYQKRVEQQLEAVSEIDDDDEAKLERARQERLNRLHAAHQNKLEKVQPVQPPQPSVSSAPAVEPTPVPKLESPKDLGREISVAETASNIFDDGDSVVRMEVESTVQTNGVSDAGSLSEDSRPIDIDEFAMDGELRKHIVTGEVAAGDQSESIFNPCDQEIHDATHERRLMQHENPVTNNVDNIDHDLFSDAPYQGVSHHIVNTNITEQIDGWDDSDGYYKYIIEQLNGRYNVFASVGRGVFSSVVMARDTKLNDTEVAIKIIRNNESMYRAGCKELEILDKLRKADPDNKRHCIQLLGHFEHRNHLCLVFEPMAMTLRQVLKKYGSGIGISIVAVRSYCKQILLAMKLMQNCNIIHADLKPDNILVNEGKNICKLSDFGSAFPTSEAVITPYLCSRFYRPPEVMLGLEYNHAVDMWSLGCTLFELYTGKYAFPGRTNNEMLKLFMDMKGRFPNRMIRKAQLRDQFFDAQMNFLFSVTDPVTKQARVTVLTNHKPTKDIKAMLLKVSDESEKRVVAQFADLLDKMLCLDPAKRISVNDALCHPFLTGRT